MVQCSTILLLLAVVAAAACCGASSPIWPSLSSDMSLKAQTSPNHTSNFTTHSSFWKKRYYDSSGYGLMMGRISNMGGVFGDAKFDGKWPNFEVNWRLVIATAVGIVGGALGSVGGVGGGGFFLPMFNLILGFDTKTSAALSKTMVMGGAISTAMFNIFQKHPFEHRPVIDYDVVVLFQPMLLLGISIGVIFNVIFAQWMITLLTVVLFSISLQSVFKKAIKMRNQETSIAEAGKITSSTSIASVTVDEDVETCEHKPVMDGNSVLGVHEEGIDWSWFPVRKWLLLLLIWAIFLMVQVLKMHTTTCSLWYWVVEGLQVPVALSTNLAFAIHLYNETKRSSKREDMYRPLLEQSQNKWHARKLLIYAVSGIGAGIVGGLLGLGGGVIMGPAFLELGLSPQVTGATSTFLMVFSASLSAVEYFLLDRLPVDFATYFCIVSFGAALWGQVVIRNIVASSGKASVIVFVLGCCMVTSTIFLGGTGAIRSYYKWIGGDSLWFEDLCSSG